MKCPKCGYNSFEFLDNCKKCGSGLGSFKASFGLRGIAPSLKPTPSADTASAVMPAPEPDAPIKQPIEAEQVDILGWPPVEVSSPLRDAETSLPGLDLGLTELQSARESTSAFGDEPLDAAGKSSEGGGEGYGDFSFEETGNEFQSPQAAPDGQTFADDGFADFLKSAASDETAPSAFSEQEFPEFAESVREGAQGAGLDSAPDVTGDGFEMEDFFIVEEPAVTGNPVKGPMAPPQKQSKD